jgi:hypothetical protein
MKRMIVVFVILLSAARWHAVAGGVDDGGQLQLTGNVRVDLFGQQLIRTGPQLPDQAAGMVDGPSRKSLWLAAGLSAVLPGAGEFYAGSVWKAALFFAIEAAAWGVAYSYDRRGDDQTESYRSFADAHWNVVRYAQFAETLAPPAQGPYMWDRGGAGVDWAELNRMERAIGGWFSHTLPPYGEQQYYELIGKYPQFNQGWDDAPATFTYGDPLTPRFLYYSGERGLANTYYDRATAFVTVALVNHLLSAVDAAWTAASYNSSLHAEVRMRPGRDRPEAVPMLAVRFGF